MQEIIGYKEETFTISEYMEREKIKSRTTVYFQMKNKVINAVDLNKGQRGRPTWRIKVQVPIYAPALQAAA